jgi:serine/threonine-protein kinase RsbW
LDKAGDGYGRSVKAVQPMRLELNNSDIAPREARLALHKWLQAVECVDPVPGDALLVVSELVTNVVTHTNSDAVVIATFDDHRLRIEVHDHDPQGPVAMPRPAVGGFGLPIVDALCDAWVGTDRHRQARVDRDALLSRTAVDSRLHAPIAG